MIAASVIINTRDEAQHIGACLDAVFAQRFLEGFEVIVVDSGSTDRTLDIVARYPVRLLQTPTERFTWGRDRNAGAEVATGRYLVFLNANAIPTSNLWLLRLVQAFKISNVAGVYGRQIPQDRAFPLEQFSLQVTYGLERRVQKWDGGQLTTDQVRFSNACSAVRRDVWAQLPFSDTALFGEDQEWCMRVLRARYQVIYEPDAEVSLAQHESLARVFKRWFTSYERSLPTGEESTWLVLRRGAGYLGAEMGYLATHGYLSWVPYAMAYEAAKLAGLTLGRYRSWLPGMLAQRIALKH